MRILTILGSPRADGNSAALAEQIAAGAAAQGVKTEVILLQKMKISPCCACDHCQVRKGNGCVIQDDMQKLYPKLLKADAFIIATPVYWCSMSAQLKAFLDRTYALADMEKLTDPFTGKKVALAMTYGNPDFPDSGAMNVIRTFQDALRFSKAELVGIVHGCAIRPGEIKTNRNLMDSAFQLGAGLGEKN